MPGQFRPADHSKGDANTIGGYMAAHDRPAAFEGSDGYSYSVEIIVEQDGSHGIWAAFFLFVKWARIGAQSPEGHLESQYLARGTTEAEARQCAAAVPLREIKALLDALIAQTVPHHRRWLDARRDERAE